MDLAKLIREKSDAQKALLKAAMDANRAMTEDEQKQFNTLEDEIKGLENTLEAQKKTQDREKTFKTPVTEPIHAEPKQEEKGLREFKNLGEQLLAIKNATYGKMDERLVRLNNQQKAVAGASEGVPSDGGFAVQTDFAGMMMESAAKAGNILPLVDQYQIGAGSNAAKWIDVDESSVATTVFGGVIVYWAAEAGEVTKSKPKMMEKSLELKKLMGVAYATYELEQDASFVSQLYTKAFTLAIQRKLEGEIISGDGAAGMLGLTKSGALVSIAKEDGQAADTVIWENLSKMYNRNLDKTKSVWLIHPDVADQLDFLSFPVGTGGVPVYLPAALVGSVSSLRGRPIIESDQCSAIGDVGDVIFADLSEYMLITKGGVQADTSIHVEFLSAENCFRFIFRANGMPKKNQSLTIKNSSNKRSPYIALAAR